MFQPKLNVLPPAQRALWPRLADLPSHFVLYGGTAVALRCGHRISEDFDFFSAQGFTSEALLAQLPWLRSPEPKVLQRQNNTLTLQLPQALGPVKVSFFGGIGFGQINPPDISPDNRLKIASPEDLLALKLGVIHQRLEAKDYLDIHALLKSGQSLAAGLSYLDTLHPLETNWAIVLKTLVYFQGGDLNRLPENVKRDLEQAVRDVREVPGISVAKEPIGSGK
jgi:Nucleotidyl transferase AbiEii toxin, Type IV TA system